MDPRHTSTFDIDARLRHIARSQLGLVTIGQAAGAGIDRWALARRREAGALELVFAGVMRLGAVARSGEQRILAASLAVPGSEIAATSAASVHGMPVHAGVEVPIVAVGASRSAHTAGVRTFRRRVELPSQPWHRARLATPAATLLLLPRFADAGTVERCLDHSLVHRLTTVPRVLRLIEELPARAIVGRRVLLDLLADRSAGIGHRSGCEQRVAGWLRAAGLRGWRRNFMVPVAGGAPVEVDFAWPAAKVALEVSPFFTHGSRAAQERDMERRRSLVAEGWRVVEATDPDLECRRSFRGVVASLRMLLDPSHVVRAA